MYRDSWPSLFVGPASARGAMHIDAFGSNFWMALFEVSHIINI
jgi:histone arginine demethylase JMJD6